MDPNKFKILIVDDNPKNIQLLANILDSEGYEIEYTTNGYEAIEWSKELSFDLILLDIMMPEINGYDVCTKIKENKDNQDTPIIFLTAKTATENIIQAFESGGADYITKPFNTLELLSRIKNQIKIQESKKIINTLYKNLKSSINYAKFIQNAVIPIEKEFNEYFSKSFLYYQPKDVVGGDFYWIKEKNNLIYLVVGDCTGHGVPGAMLSMLAISILDNMNHENIQLASEFQEHLQSSILKLSIGKNYKIFDNVESCSCIIDKRNSTVQFSNGNFPLIISSKEKKLDGLNRKDGYMFSLNENTKYFVESIKLKRKVLDTVTNQKMSQNKSIKISKEDTIYLISDGFSDQFGFNTTKKYSKSKLLNFIGNMANVDYEKHLTYFKEEFANWKKDGQQTDDIIIFSFKL